MPTAYSTYTAEEVAALDRMEAEHNAAHRARRALRYAEQAHPIREFGDDSLRRFAVRYRRELDDIASGDLPGGDKRARLVRARLHDVEREQEFRAALAESWLPSEDGTDCYTAFQGRGGLAAVLHGDATPPSYDLAVTLDWEHWKRGLPSVLDWDGAGS